MLAKVTTTTPWGVDARPVMVEVDVHNGLPQMQMARLLCSFAYIARAQILRALRVAVNGLVWSTLT